jgi:hypothetical protein
LYNDEDASEEYVETRSDLFTTIFEGDDKVFINKFLRDQLRMEFYNESDE